MDVKPLDWLLDTLAKAESHLQEEDRAACARVADALRHRCTGFSGPIRVVLVTGPDADWLTQEVEWLAEALDEDRDRRRMIASQVETLLDELRERRKRITAERDVLARIVERVNDGWDYVKPLAPAGERGVWFRFQDGANNIVMEVGAERLPHEPMTDAEQVAIYGEVVEATPQNDPTPQVGCGGRDL